MAKAAGGFTHTLFLTGKGELYGCGDNRDARLGIHNQKDKVFVPSRIDVDNQISDISASDFSVAVSSEGDMYVWGSTPSGMVTELVIEDKFAKMV